MAESDWGAIFGVGTPVPGEPDDVQAAIDEFRRRKIDAQAVLDTFRAAGGGHVQDHLEGSPAVLLAATVEEVGHNLPDLVRVAGAAEQVLKDHLTALDDLRDEADAAIARARTAFDERDVAEGQVAALRRQIQTLDGQIDGLADGADSGPKEDELERVRADLRNKEGTVSDRTDTLRSICAGAMGGYGDTEYGRLVGEHTLLQRDTRDKLHEMDLGSLKDPGFWERLGTSVAGFVGGIVESLVNFVEALLTGDWATMWWELRNLLNAALLILGTIALFTGVGAPLFVLAVAAFAVTAGLAITQTPNPQTGETLGIGDVALAAVGVVFSAGGAYGNYTKNGLKLFTGFRSSSTGLRQGALFSGVRDMRNLATLRQGGPAAQDAARSLRIISGRHVTYSFPAYRASTVFHGARVTYSATGTAGKVQNLAATGTYVVGGHDITLGPLDTITRAKGRDGVVEVAGGLEGVAGRPTTPGNSGTPVFGPKVTPRQQRDLQRQLHDSPDVVLVGAP